MIVRNLNDKLKEDRADVYQAMLDIGKENPRPGWRLAYFIVSVLYDILVWITEKKYLQ